MAISSVDNDNFFGNPAVIVKPEWKHINDSEDGTELHVNFNRDNGVNRITIHVFRDMSPEGEITNDFIDEAISFREDEFEEFLALLTFKFKQLKIKY